MCSADFRFPESPRPFPQFCNEPQSFNPSGDGTKLYAASPLPFCVSRAASVMTAKEPVQPAPSEFAQSLASLVANFESETDYYLSKAYPEAQARVDFITPLFEALGWDVENEAGLPHLARDVIVERGEADTTGRPDYNFRLNRQTRFFVEAKAPADPLGREIAATDREIDELVYELYGITAEERKIIEGT